MKRVSFDFDDCLYGGRGSGFVQRYCSVLMTVKSVEIWIVTSRPRDPKSFFEKKNGPTKMNFWSNEEDLFPLASNLGIPRERIVFTEHEPKAHWFQEHGPDFVWHLDDNLKEIRDIHSFTKVVPISVLSPNWANKCNKLLDLGKSLDNMLLGSSLYVPSDDPS